MHECLLCKRNMKISDTVFGNGCIRNIYSFLNLKMPKKINLREKTLYKSIMKMNNIHSLNKHQEIWLTDRFLTYQYLNSIPYGNFDLIKNQINSDIQNVKQLNTKEEPKSSQKIGLKQAYDLFKKVKKFQDGLEKLVKGNFTDEDSIQTIIASISFIFNMAKNKSQFEKSAYKAMQYAFWQTVIEIGGKYADFPISAYFLQHSLEKNPKDLFIDNGKIIQEILADASFNKTINDIVKEQSIEKNQFTYDSSTNHAYQITFNNKDLYFAIHYADIRINACLINQKWNLTIQLFDRYDYTKPKMPSKYYNDTSSISKSLFSSTLYNLAHFSVLCGVLKEYNITIQLHIDGFEVK